MVEISGRTEERMHRIAVYLPKNQTIMKRLIYLIGFLLVVAPSAFGQNGHMARYAIEVNSDNPQYQSIIPMLEGSKMLVASDGLTSYSKMEMGMMNTTQVSFDTKTNKMLMLMNAMGREMAFEGIKEEEKEEKEINYEINLTSETKKIIGYTCKKAVITTEEGNEVDVWYTEELVRPKGIDNMPDMIPGWALEFQTSQNDMVMKFTCTELNKNISMKDYQLVIPEGVTVQSLDELKKMQPKR